MNSNLASSSSLLATLFAVALSLTGCMTGAAHRADVEDQTTDRLSVGTVQREIRVGMSGADVATVLGAPNIVTTDERRRETWVYDRKSTERAVSSSGAYGTLLLVGGGGSAGASQTTQRTLTVVIRFDDGGHVRDFSY